MEEDFCKEVQEIRNTIIERITPVLDQIILVKKRYAYSYTIELSDEENKTRKEEFDKLLRFYSQMLDDILGLN